MTDRAALRYAVKIVLKCRLPKEHTVAMVDLLHAAWLAGYESRRKEKGNAVYAEKHESEG